MKKGMVLVLGILIVRLRGFGVRAVGWEAGVLRGGGLMEVIWRRYYLEGGARWRVDRGFC
jgi:hypothetical protein